MKIQDTIKNTAKIIDGKTIAKNIENKIISAVDILKTKHDISPKLAVIIIEGNPASEIYVRHKQKKAESLGIQTIIKRYPKNISLIEIEKQIKLWNNDKTIHGILLQLPLPDKQDSYPLIQAIDPQKDVDGLHALNIGKLSWQKEPKLIACTPSGCMLLLESVIKDFTGMHAVVVGCSNLVGRPMAQLLLQKDCTVSIAHSKTPDISVLTRMADILVVATGCPNLIRGDMIKPNVIIIDVGINRLDDGRITGDVCFNESLNITQAISPVPGGVGPMTIVCLMKNTILAACIQNNLPSPSALH